MSISRSIGFQSGDVDETHGSIFASSMVYNSINQEITIVGGTSSNYFKPGEQPKESVLDSDCFVAILHLKDPNRPSWVRRRQYGNPSVSEFCSSIISGKDGRTLVVGHSDDHGILSHLLPHGDSPRSVYGMVLDLDDTISLDGGTLLHSNEVQYPTGITTDATGEEIYVAEIFTDQKPNPALREGGADSSLENEGVDLSVIGYSTPHTGQKFSVRLEKFTIFDERPPTNGQNSGIDETLHSEWSREYGTIGLENVQVSALQYASSEALVVVGYTRGSGGVFGIPGGTSSDTIDSFISVFTPSTGRSVNSMRIESNLPGDDKVLGMCMGQNNTVFLVGMTTGVFDTTYLIEDFSQHQTFAFILKIDLADLSIIWGRQIGGSMEFGYDNATSSQVHGVACAVTPDGQEVYIAGNVEDGATLILPEKQDFESAGGTDVFIAKFLTEDGRLDYALQTGSTGKDTVASGNGLSLDETGNLILLGNTNGEMYREKKDQTTTDVFLMSFDRLNGDFAIPYHRTGKAVASTEKRGGKIFGDRFTDSVKQARYENVMAAMITLLVLSFTMFSLAIWMKKKQIQAERKGEAHQKTVRFGEEFWMRKFWRSSDSADSSGNERTWSVLSTTNVSSAVSSEEMGNRVESKPRVTWAANLASATNLASGEDSNSMSNFYSNELSRSVMSIIGNPELPALPTLSGVLPSRSTENEVVEIPLSVNAIDLAYRESNREEGSAYQDVFDLIEQASERLSEGSDDDEYFCPETAIPGSSNIDSDDEITLDSIWNMDLTSPDI